MAIKLRWYYKPQPYKKHPDYLEMSQLMRLWYLSHKRPSKAQTSLRIRAVSQEPSLFTHIKYGGRRRVRQKNQKSIPTGWLRMRVWRMSLRRTKSTISWDGSNEDSIGSETNLFMQILRNIPFQRANKKIKWVPLRAMKTFIRKKMGHAM